MALLLRRSCAILVLLLTLTPLLAGAAEAGKARPVAWLEQKWPTIVRTATRRKGVSHLLHEALLGITPLRKGHSRF